MLKIVVLLGLVVALTLGCTEKGNVFELQVGDCFNYIHEPQEDGEEIVDVDYVECSELHQREVYAVLELPDTEDAPFPGLESIRNTASGLCLDSFEGFVGMAYDVSSLDIEALHPQKDTWENHNDRKFTCSLYDLFNSHMEGSMRGSKR